MVFITDNFTVHTNIIPAELETELYRWMGISSSTHGLGISTRFNAGLQLTPPIIFYTELQLLSNDTWRLIVNHSVQLGTLQ
jgi:hypothetical protein